MASLDVDHSRNPPPESGYGSGESNASRSPLNVGLDFLKGITEKKTTRNGQPPKRRGPKPDSKPALTRRQELNRQAQRSHRERKELYIKALEDQVSMLKEKFAKASQDRDAIKDENQQLRDLLQQHGIANTIRAYRKDSNPDFGSSSGSISGSYPGSGSQSFSPPSTTGGYSAPSQQTLAGSGRLQQSGIDYEQRGIDFVLTLEHSCKGHLQPLMARAQSSGIDPVTAVTTEPEISGHAMMLSAPPYSHLLNHPEDEWHADPIEFKKLSVFNSLLDSSLRLELDGEVTPVMAWGMLLADARVGELKEADFEMFRGLLLERVRCYGFGAVLEDFEVRDAIEKVFAQKQGGYNVYIG